MNDRDRKMLGELESLIKWFEKNKPDIEPTLHVTTKQYERLNFLINKKEEPRLAKTKRGVYFLSYKIEPNVSYE